MSEIYLIRHGQASFGAENYDRLSATGRRQAEILARFLTVHDIRFDAIYSGAMARQQDTARPLCRSHGVTPRVTAAFDEYDHKALIMTRIRRAEAQGDAADLPPRNFLSDMQVFQLYFDETVTRWMAGVYDDTPQVESWVAFSARVAAGLQAMMADQGRGKRLALFTSGGPISVVVGKILGLTHDKIRALSWEILNASITGLKYSEKALSLSVFNTTTHLLIEGDPALLTLR